MNRGDSDLVSCEYVTGSDTSGTLKCYFFVVLVILFGLISLHKFWKRRRDIMIRQRAPNITIVQFVSYIFMLFVPLVSDVLLKNGTFKWRMARSEKEIPASRYIIKYLYILFRFNINLLIPFRLVVIWFQLIDHHIDKKKLSRLFRRVSSVMVSGKASTILLIVLTVVLMLLFYPHPGSFLTERPALDWFDMSNQTRNKFLSLSNIYILEQVLASLALYLVRKYPDDINIVREYIYLIVAGYACQGLDTFIDLAATKDGTGETYSWYGCVPVIGFRTDYLNDMMRAVLFFMITNYFSSVSSSLRRVSTPFLYRLDDFCKFAKNVGHLRRFIAKRYPDLLDVYDKAIEDMLDVDQVRSQDSTVFPLTLQEAFKKFKDTRCYHTLEKMNNQAERVFARGYGY